MRRLARAIVKSLITSVIFFILFEAALRGGYFVRNSVVRLVPLPYAVGDEYGPIPPWLDRLLLLVPDDALIWRVAPNVERTYLDIFSPVHSEADRIALLRRFIPTVPEEFRRNPTWHISINSQGFRTAEFGAKTPGTVRIACVGDSWTFGMPVNQDETYPSRLAALVGAAHPDRRYEVLNFGILGYSSFQGLELIKRRVLDLSPDIVAIGFGMNDSEVAGYRDKDMIAGPHPRRTLRPLAVARELEFVKLLDYFALRLKFRPKLMSAYLQEEADTKDGAVDYDAMDPWTRVSPHDFERNVREMIRLSTARGARVVLLDNELWKESPYRPVLRRIASDLNVPLVDSLTIVEDAKERMIRDLESRLHLAQHATAPPAARPASPAQSRIVFRLFRGTVDVPKALSIVGPHAQLGDLTPNLVLMHDDGKDGDERAGDGVWSLAVSFPPGARVTYVYTNSGATRRWEGLDIPHTRHVLVPEAHDGRPIYLPVETFGQLYMQGDGWHTNAAGYDLIARGVLQGLSSHQR
jgi:lysophospholipase L1-like esterase